MMCLIATLALLVLTAVVWRLAVLAQPDQCWRCRLGHGAWVAAHVLIGVGALQLIVACLRGAIDPAPVSLLLAGLVVMLLGRWRRRADERHSSTRSST